MKARAIQKRSTSVPKSLCNDVSQTAVSSPSALQRVYLSTALRDVQINARLIGTRNTNSDFVSR